MDEKFFPFSFCPAFSFLSSELNSSLVHLKYYYFICFCSYVHTVHVCTCLWRGPPSPSVARPTCFWRRVSYWCGTHLVTLDWVPQEFSHPCPINIRNIDTCYHVKLYKRFLGIKCLLILAGKYFTDWVMPQAPDSLDGVHTLYKQQKLSYKADTDDSSTDGWLQYSLFPLILLVNFLAVYLFIFDVVIS